MNVVTLRLRLPCVVCPFPFLFRRSLCGEFLSVDPHGTSHPFLTYPLSLSGGSGCCLVGSVGSMSVGVECGELSARECECTEAKLRK